MFQLALCDDQSIVLDAHTNVCRAIFEKLNIEYQISAFASSADFILALGAGQRRFDMILLDIVIDGVDGIRLARMIREVDEDAAIVFITSYDAYALQGYDVKALHYLLKPLDPTLLESLINSVYTEKYLAAVWIVKSGERHKRIPIKEIVCMETVGRHVEVSLTGGTVNYPGKLSDILSELPAGLFVRCHQAFAVNIENIRELTRRKVIAVNGKEIPVSRTFLQGIRTAFLRQISAG